VGLSFRLLRARMTSLRSSLSTRLRSAGQRLMFGTRFASSEKLRSSDLRHRSAKDTLALCRTKARPSSSRQRNIVAFSLW